jgi:hypothetical protein
MADGEGAAGLAEKLAGLSADGGEEPQLSKKCASLLLTMTPSLVVCLC